MVWVIQLQFLCLLTVYSFYIFSYKECNQSDFSIDHLVMSMCKVISCVVEKRCLLWPVCSLGRILLAFALLHSVLQGQSCLLLQVSLDFLLLHYNPLWRIVHLFLVLVLEGLLGLHRTNQFQLLLSWAPSNPNMLLFPEFPPGSYIPLSDYLFIFIRMVYKC